MPFNTHYLQQPHTNAKHVILSLSILKYFIVVVVLYSWLIRSHMSVINLQRDHINYAKNRFTH